MFEEFIEGGREFGRECISSSPMLEGHSRSRDGMFRMFVLSSGDVMFESGEGMEVRSFDEFPGSGSLEGSLI